MYYYKKHIGDYRSATGHLSLLEHGVYTCLMDSYYLNEQGLPMDERQLFRLAGARTDEEKQAVLDVVNEFFIPQETVWVHSRIDFELKKYHAKAETNRKVGGLGGRPPKKPKENPNGFSSEEEETQKEPIENPNPLTQEPINQEPIIDIPSDKKLKKSKNVLRTLPSDFGISERVFNWAKKEGYENLELHLERFIETATMKAYKYADWDLAFMKAIREDWGKVNKPVYQNNGFNQPQQNTRMQEIEQQRQEWERNNGSIDAPF